MQIGVKDKVSIQTLRFHPECTYHFGSATPIEEEEEEELSDSLPSDVSEQELLDLLTECMAIKLLKNKSSQSQILEVLKQFDCRPELT